MLTESKLLAEIVSRVQTLSSHDAADLTAGDIAQAIGAVYYASIRREEGERVLPHLILLSEKSLGRVRKMVPILRTEGVDAVTPELLRKRSLAFDRRASSFLAVPRSEGEIEFAGVAHWGWDGNSRNTQMRHLPAVYLDAEDAGTVAISFGRTRLGVFRDGNFYSARPSVFSSPVFRRCLSSTFFHLQTNQDRILATVASLQYLVQEAMSYARGGTIVILEDYLSADIDSYCEAGEIISYELPRNEAGNIPLGFNQAVLDWDFKQTSINTLSELRRAYLRFIARLSCIDGALLLNGKLEPLRIGTKLHSPASTATVYLGGAPNKRISPVLKGVGTRHTSALNFVSHLKQAIAFTISSDGPVSTFGWVEHRLAWWKNSVQM